MSCNAASSSSTSPWRKWLRSAFAWRCCFGSTCRAGAPLSSRSGSPCSAPRFFRSPENAPARFRRKRSSASPMSWRRPRPFCFFSRAAEGDEEIKQMLVGNILLVTPTEVWKCFAVFVAVGAFAFRVAPKFSARLLRSRWRLRERDCGCAGGIFFFTRLFGLVVTIFVRIAGVLLVFSYLIVPAVCGINLARGTRARLLIGWLVARSAALAVCSFLLLGLAVGRGDCLHVRRLACARVCGCVIEEEAAAIVMAHGAATGINLVLGSAGCQPAVRGSLPRTDFDPEVIRERTSLRRSGRMQASSLRSPESIAPIVNCESLPARE